MNPELLEQIKNKSHEEKVKEAEYIANTIPSSWEFVDFTFLICNVSRAFTHQFVRSRHASFAQQTMRVLNVKGWDYETGPSIEERPEAKMLYEDTMAVLDNVYSTLIGMGAKIEDARGILPTNILTNILVKMNLRTFAEMVHKRSSSRVQGEYRTVLAMMKEEAINALPWVELFVARTFDKAADELDAMIRDGNQHTPEIGTIMIKLLDQMRMKS